MCHSSANFLLQQYYGSDASSDVPVSDCFADRLCHVDDDKLADSVIFPLDAPNYSTLRKYTIRMNILYTCCRPSQDLINYVYTLRQR